MTIDKAYCINIASRVDRWAQAQAEFERIGLTVERFNAYSGDNGPLAFNRSQHECIRRGYESGADCFAIFEDDCVFEGSWIKVDEVLNSMPYGWVSLHLGCNFTTDFFRRPDRIAANLVRLNDCWQSHAIVYSRPGAEYILRMFNPDGPGWMIYDEWLRQTIMKEGNMYLIDPMVCYQRASHSDIWGTHADYTGVHTMGNHLLKMI